MAKVVQVTEAYIYALFIATHLIPIAFSIVVFTCPIAHRTGLTTFALVIVTPTTTIQAVTAFRSTFGVIILARSVHTGFTRLLPTLVALRLNVVAVVRARIACVTFVTLTCTSVLIRNALARCWPGTFPARPAIGIFDA
jgi:hypothetical protein